MKVIALKKAIEVATTLADWIEIAGQVNGKQRTLAYGKILDFDPTEGDIRLFCDSGAERLRSIGWYLSGRRSRQQEIHT